MAHGHEVSFGGSDKNTWNLVEVVVAPHCAPRAGELFILKWLVSH